MLSIHYFASTREKVGIASETLEKDESLATVNDLIDQLSASHEGFRLANQDTNKLLVSVNQAVVGRDHALHDGDEVAFFPPMTGG